MTTTWQRCRGPWKIWGETHEPSRSCSDRRVRVRDLLGTCNRCPDSGDHGETEGLEVTDWGGAFGSPPSLSRGKYNGS